VLSLSQQAELLENVGGGGTAPAFLAFAQGGKGACAVGARCTELSLLIATGWTTDKNEKEQPKG
jgi:hypothetical protein